AGKAKNAVTLDITATCHVSMQNNFVTIRKAVKKMATIDRMKQDGTFNALSEKERLAVDRLRAKLEKNLGSISDMSRLPAALFVVDTTRERIAVAEAMKLGIPIFAMVDTNSDPREINYVIPSNDDASKSIESIMSFVSEAIIEGLSDRKSGGSEEGDEEEKMEIAAKRAPKKAKVTDDVEIPSTDKEDVEAMEEAKKPVSLKSKKEVLSEEE